MIRRRKTRQILRVAVHDADRVIKISGIARYNPSHGIAMSDRRIAGDRTFGRPSRSVIGGGEIAVAQNGRPGTCIGLDGIVAMHLRDIRLGMSDTRMNEGMGYGQREGVLIDVARRAVVKLYP